MSFQREFWLNIVSSDSLSHAATTVSPHVESSAKLISMLKVRCVVFVPDNAKEIEPFFLECCAGNQAERFVISYEGSKAYSVDAKASIPTAKRSRAFCLDMTWFWTDCDKECAEGCFDYFSVYLQSPSWPLDARHCLLMPCSVYWNSDMVESSCVWSINSSSLFQTMPVDI